MLSRMNLCIIFIAVVLAIAATLIPCSSAAVDTAQEPLNPADKEDASVQQPLDEIPEVIPEIVQPQIISPAPPVSEPDPSDPNQCNDFGGTRIPILLGMPGPPGPHGPQGIPGVQGPAGMPGNHGNNGINGEPGFPGVKGQKGAKGEPGIPGLHGTHGTQGPVGPRGNIGYPGERGAKGSQGLPGPIGLTGPPGSTGVTGPRGVPGFKGDLGGIGPKGDKGDCACPPPNPESTKRKKISFSVARTTGLTADRGPVIMKWDQVLNNVGGNFNIQTGIFNCSVAGSYYFAFHIYKSSNQNFPLVQLMKNGEHMVGAIDYGPMDSEDSTSNSAILDLLETDLVWLQLYEGREVYSSHYKFTTFSGFLIFPD